MIQLKSLSTQSQKSENVCHGSHNKTKTQLIKNNFIQNCNQIHFNMICKTSNSTYSGVI